MWAWLKRIVTAFVVFLAIAQIIRPLRTNPPTDPKREIYALLPVGPGVASIFSRACDDCHSHRTGWPWYSGVSPVSWLVAYDVREGRRKMNFSEWEAPLGESTRELVKKICEEVKEGEMPGRMYSLLHPEATISPADAQTVCSWSHTVGESLAKLAAN